MGNEGKEKGASHQHGDKHFPQRAHAVADHAPKGHRCNGKGRGQGVHHAQLRGGKANALQVDGLVGAESPGKPEEAVHAREDQRLAAVVIQAGK